MIRTLITGLILSLSISVAVARDAGGGLVIYSSNPAAAIEAAGFAIKEHTGLDSFFSMAGSGVLTRKIKAEAEATRADIFWSASVSTLGAFTDLFQPYDAPALADIPDNLHYKNNLLLPTSIHVATLLVNSDRLEGAEIPTSWAALTDPVWKGRIIIPDPANSSTGYAILYGLSKLLDRDSYLKLVENLVVAPTSAIAHEATAAGEYAVGLTFEINSYAYIQNGESELNLIYPSDGTFVTTDYAGIIRHSGSGPEAMQAMDTLLSYDTQIALLKAGYRRPSRSDIQVSDYVMLPDLFDILVFAIDENQAAAERKGFLVEWALLPKASVLD